MAGSEGDRGGERESGARGPLSRLRTLPDRITASRIAAIPFLWVIAALHHPAVLGVGVLIASGTDLLAGSLARRSRQTSAFGSRLDSIADHLLTTSTLLWLVWLRPHFFRNELPLLLGWTALALAVLALGWRRRGQVANYHLYSGKLAGFLGYLFAITLLVRGTYSRVFFLVVLGAASFACLEMLVAILTRVHGDERLGSVLLPGLRRRGGKRSERDRR